MKVLVLDMFQSFSLLPYLKEKLGDKHEFFSMAKLDTDQLWEIFKRVDPDVVFVDFCNENAVHLTTRLKAEKVRPRVVIRLHAYEADSWYMDHIHWDQVDELITIAPIKYKIVKEKLQDKVPIHLVYNGMDLNRFQLQKPHEGSDIAYVGYLNQKKGPALLKAVFASFPDKQFHVGGVFQDPHVLRLLTDDLPKNVKMYGWINPTEFLQGKRFIITTSVTEGSAQSVSEGMAMGLTPLVYGWPGAEDIYPKDLIWRSFQDLRKIIDTPPKDPAWCRKWIVERYSMDKCINSLISLLRI